MSQRRVSIQDIARIAGVSHSTVSRALRNSPLVNPATRERIQQLSRELSYIPNAVAQSLQTHRSKTVGLVVTSIADPFFVDVVEGVEQVARPAGLSVFLNASHNDADQEIEVIEVFHRRRVDGILVAASRLGRRHADHLERIGVPVVLINSQAEGDYEYLHSVSVDDRAGAHMAVEHLLKLGHRRIGYLGVGNRPRSNRRRHDGYVAALTAAGIVPAPEWQVIAPVDNQRHDGDVLVGQQLLPAMVESGVSALFCYNDMVAVGALVACRERGMRVPQELSVIGFDDIDLARYVAPPLTTVHQPKREMGELAMRMLLDLIDGRPVANAVIQPQLAQRGSTAPRA